MSDMHLVLHGLAIKKHGTPEAVAGIVGLDAGQTESLLREAAEKGRAVEANGGYMLTPAARMALDSEYSRYYGGLRAEQAFTAAYEQFETLNTELKQLMTDWQTMTLGGKTVPNDHSNSEYDDKIIDRLGDLHERNEVVLDRLAEHLPRMAIYKTKLLEALERSEDGEIDYVSGSKVESYHTLWFELHEDLLRILGREREE